MSHAEMSVAASWDLGLVARSYVVAVLASYTALDSTNRSSAKLLERRALRKSP